MFKTIKKIIELALEKMRGEVSKLKKELEKANNEIARLRGLRDEYKRQIRNFMNR